MKIEILDKSEYGKLEEFLLNIHDSLIYSSTLYKEFLEIFLNERAVYFVLKDGDEIVALLPAFLKENKQYGNILNSLPFYGSNGGVIALQPSETIYSLLVSEFDRFAVANHCISSTLITSPFDPLIEWYHDNVICDFKDQRIGQITELPAKKDDVMDIYHSKTRNTVRKALNGIKRIDYKDGLAYLDFIVETHKMNLVAINGLYKPKSFFESLVANFEYDKNLRIYIAFNEDEEPVAGLLNLYYNKTVEYFTPVTLAEYREQQPLSGIIYQSMQDAVEQGYERWNWGGTWLSQGGVYKFKSRWGTSDHNYFYFTKIYDEKVYEMTTDQLLKEFPYFYVIPFSALSPK